MKRCLSILAILLLAGLVWEAKGGQPKKDPNAFMQLKLQNSQMVLNGIALGNFETIETSALDLVKLSRKAEFQLMKTKEYAKHSEEFRTNAENIAKMAQAKNLEGAALAYVQLTLNCVNCHKYLRDPP